MARGALLELPAEACEAYDLAPDRAERENRIGSTWPEDLAAQASASWVAIRAPLSSVPEVRVEGDLAEELQHLGYGR